MKRSKQKNLAKTLRKKRTRAAIVGSSVLPRLCVFRSNKGLYVQLIDDNKQQTLAAASSSQVKGKETKDMSAGVAQAFALGEMIAKKALEAKVSSAVFDRGAYAFHGKVKAVAEGARKGGLKL